MSELESRIIVLSRLMPESALVNADTLWDIPYYESKKDCNRFDFQSYLMHMKKNFSEEFRLWLSVELEESLIKDLLAAVETKPVLLQSKQWLDLIKTWLNSKDTSSG